MQPDDLREFSVHWRSLGQVLRETLAGCRESFALVAPFIKRDAFQDLLRAVPSSASITVVTRWRPAEVANGVSDTSVFDEQEADDRITIYLNDALHAKLYMIDSTLAFVGSANCTSTGLSLQDAGSIELLVEIARCPVALAVFVKRLILDSVPATSGIRSAVDALAAQLAASSTRLQLPNSVAAPFSETEREVLARMWLPASRFPDQLFAVYADDAAVSLAAREAGATDLAWIQPPLHLDKRVFESFVREWLQGQPLVHDLNRFLGDGKFFGEIADWFEIHAPTADTRHVTVQKHLQTLERWLLHFCGDLYALDSPNYSERLRLKRPGY